eukprot:TRINITY_DN4132_c0_g1_i1.p1 TRINITY_DN4132_c0_g1~~TRINITY_DN4132_c0_g1_i1.p1  ORF type:complete len:649 (-),score=152.89 TRINITY_DN4132_c0_g1_i1:85-2031(-)
MFISFWFLFALAVFAGLNVALKCCAVGVLVWITYHVTLLCLEKRKAKQIASEIAPFKRNQQQLKFEHAKQLLKELKLGAGDHSLIKLSVTDLLKKIQNGDLKIKDVVSAYCVKAMDSQTKYNCVTECCMAEALDEALRMDARDSSSEEKTNSPQLLRGIPLSLKDMISVRGLDNSCGVAKFCRNPATEDALIVKALRSAGAIPFLKSNVPQAMLSFECKNPVWGKCVNPYHADYTCGGSSGGEACLLATDSSAIGIGTDVGGSVRIPAHFCGICALKPTSRRVSTMGFRTTIPGQEAIPSICGVMGRTVEDLLLPLKVFWSESVFEQDVSLIPKVFDEKMANQIDKKLTVGYYLSDGWIDPSPACVRAVQTAVQLLQANGHTVVECSPPDIHRAQLLYYSLITADKAAAIRDTVTDEIFEDYTYGLVYVPKVPSWLRKSIGWLLEKCIADKQYADVFRAMDVNSVHECWVLQCQRALYRQQFASKLRQLKCDVLICPAHVLPAVEHGAFLKISSACCYTQLYNLLDWPAGIVPVTHVRSTDVYTSKPKSFLEKNMRLFYDPMKGQGLPVGIQVVGLPYEDEKVLCAMRIIQSLVNYNRDFTTNHFLASSSSIISNKSSSLAMNVSDSETAATVSVLSTSGSASSSSSL